MDDPWSSEKCVCKTNTRTFTASTSHTGGLVPAFIPTRQILLKGPRRETTMEWLRPSCEAARSAILFTARVESEGRKDQGPENTSSELLALQQILLCTVKRSLRCTHAVARERDTRRHQVALNPAPTKPRPSPNWT